MLLSLAYIRNLRLRGIRDSKIKLNSRNRFLCFNFVFPLFHAFSFSTIDSSVSLWFLADPPILKKESKMIRRLEIITAKTDKGVSSEVVPYNRQISRCLAEGKLDDAKRIILEMQSLHISPDENTYWLMIDSSGQQGNIKEMLKWFHEMEISSHLKPNIYIYNSVLSALGRSNQMGKVFQIFEKILSGNPKPNAATYSILIDALGKQGNLRKMLEVFNQMKLNGVKPVGFTYAHMMDAFGKHGYPDLMVKCFEIMLETGVLPSLPIYNQLIDAFGKRLDLKSMLKYFHRLQRDGLKPSDRTYNSIIDAHGKCGQLDVMLGYFKEMQKCGIRPTVITYNSLMNTLGRSGCRDRISEMVKLFEQMTDVQGIQPNDHTFPIILDVFSKCGDIDSMFLYLKKFYQWKLPVGIGLFVPFIEYYGKLGDLKRVRSYYEHMKVLGIANDTLVYNAVLNAFARQGDILNMIDFYEKMKRDRIKRDRYTTSVILLGFRVKDDLKGMLEIYQSFVTDGLSVDVHGFSTIMDAFAMRGDIVQMENWLDQMETKGIERTAETYGILMKGYSRGGLFSKVLDTYRLLHLSGMKIPSAIIAVLIDACGFAKDDDMVTHLLLEIKAKIITSDSNVFTSAVEAFCRCGQFLKAIEVFDQILEFGLPVDWKTSTTMLSQVATSKELFVSTSGVDSKNNVLLISIRQRAARLKELIDSDRSMNEYRLSLFRNLLLDLQCCLFSSKLIA